MSSVVNSQQNGAAAAVTDWPSPDARASSAASTAGARNAHVVILGAGPAGAGASYRLAQRQGLRVTVLEQRDSVGGNAGSFKLDGICCDYGSHRLHPVVEPDVMRDMEKLLGDDLLWRVRHGRILLKGRWIHFPLKPVDLLLRLPPRFALSIVRDLARKLLTRPSGGEDTFESILRRSLGPTICEEFYFPYARKLWGIEPKDLAETAARRRVSGSSIGKILKKVAGQIPGLKSPTAGRFYYPRQGYGQISQRYADAARTLGAEFLFQAAVTAIETDGSRVTGVRYQQGDQEKLIPADLVWSTLPVSLLARFMRPEPPPDVVEAARGMKFRGMILIYLILEQDQFSPTDAYYFPESIIPISRMSEPKNFTGTAEPRGRTVLCAELPSDPGQPEWELSDDELGRRLTAWLERARLPVTAPIKQVVTRRLSHAYPVYTRDFESRQAKLDAWIGGIDGLLTFGRQGLFAHDNTHHALATAYAAANCLDSDGVLDRPRWAEYRRKFETHVVED
jgi:protoporphyrinogen oxidase